MYLLVFYHVFIVFYHVLSCFLCDRTYLYTHYYFLI